MDGWRRRDAGRGDAATRGHGDAATRGLDAVELVTFARQAALCRVPGFWSGLA
jgi:hypothetical protein